MTKRQRLGLVIILIAFYAEMAARHNPLLVGNAAGAIFTIAGAILFIVGTNMLGGDRQ